MIRPADVEDAEALAKLCGMVQALHVEHRGDVFHPGSEATLAAWFRETLSGAASQAWIAHEEGEPVGYVYTVLHERGETAYTKPMRWIEVVQLGVKPGHQRRGIARALIDTVVDHARASDIHDLRIKTWAFNAAAQTAFQRLGFRPRATEFDLNC